MAVEHSSAAKKGEIRNCFKDAAAGRVTFEKRIIRARKLFELLEPC